MNPKTEPPWAIVTDRMLDALSEKARRSERRRANHNLHRLEDRVQRMLNAIEPGSYVRPHRHVSPPKVECFVWLRGRLAFFVFDDRGNVNNLIQIGEETGVRCVDVKPGCWHALVSLAAGSAVLEAKDGPYVASEDKEFPSWAPAEDSPEAGPYLKGLEDRARHKEPNPKKPIGKESP